MNSLLCEVAVTVEFVYLLELCGYNLFAAAQNEMFPFKVGKCWYIYIDIGQKMLDYMELNARMIMEWWFIVVCYLLQDDLMGMTSRCE